MSQKGLTPILIVILVTLGIGSYILYSSKLSLDQESAPKASFHPTSSPITSPNPASTPIATVKTQPKSSPTSAPSPVAIYSSSVKLESISPNTASINDQLTIKGQKFVQNQGKLLIYMRESPSYSSLYEIEKWSDTEIVAKLKFVSGGQFYIRVETTDGQRSNELPLKVISGQPYISSVTPTLFKKGTSVTISGYDFGSSEGKINFNSSSGYGNLLGYGIIGSWADTQIILTVPPNLESKEYSLEIVTSDNRKSSYKYFYVVD